MNLIFWLILLLVFYWLMVETKWLRIKLEPFKLPKFNIVDIVPIIFTAAIVMQIVKSMIPPESNTHWWQRLFKKRIRVSPIEKLIVGMNHMITGMVASELLKNLTKDFRSKVDEP